MKRDEKWTTRQQQAEREDHDHLVRTLRSRAELLAKQGQISSARNLDRAAVALERWRRKRSR